MYWHDSERVIFVEEGSDRFFLSRARKASIAEVVVEG
jgi:hypothetical protein